VLGSDFDLHTSYSNSEFSMFFLIPPGSFLGGKSITISFQLLLIIMALQLFMQSFGLLNQFLPSSSILDKGLPI
jgi:hypothetical protein